MWALLALGIAAVTAPATAGSGALQDPAPLSITYDAAAGWAPVLRIGPVLGDRELEQIARSGVPIRLRVHVELWKDRFFDALIDSAGWSAVVLYDPIGDIYLVRGLPGASQARRFSNFAQLRTTVETAYHPRIRPREAGRYYYIASLQIETLSLSDLDELERWVQGELQPAVSGQRSIPGAIGMGARRLMLRLLDLPARRFDARTARFRVG